MKKLIFVFFLFLVLSKNVFAIETIAKQAILYDMDTKSVLFKKNSDQLVSPSSMSKIMTIYYVFKKISEGELSLQDEFIVSKKAWKKGGSKMFVKVNEKVKVEDLIRGIIVQSGNDACIVLAEGLSGSEKLFSEELTELGKEIGLKNSFFTNSTGWPDPQHLMTVDDLLTLSIRTIKDFPDFFHYYSEKEFTFSGIKQLNRNPLLFTDLNSDGLKTGHTSLGGYGLVATVKKNDRRLILVLNGLNSSKDRAKEAQRLLKIGFNQYEILKIAEANKNIKTLNVWGGDKKKINIFSKDEIKITIPKKIKKQLSFAIKYQSPLIPPITSEEPIGEFLIKKNKEILKKFKLFTDQNVRKMNFFQKIGHNFRYLLFGESVIINNE
ncbi:MAG: D-alanyl-D-alanine carboxypeptidase family protein [Alphaproteobacteria bacterium]